MRREEDAHMSASSPPTGSQASRRPVLEASGLHKVYRTETVETRVLTGVDLCLHQGDFVALMGASGSGKSTLMSILGLLDDPTDGIYRLGGHQVNGLSESRRAKVRNAHIGFVFQAFNLIGDLSVQQNVELPLVYRGGIRPAVRRERALEVLRAVGMEHRAKHHPSQLSGGQQQRVAVARAMVTQPDIVLADEPTGNLDSHAAEAVMQLIAKANAEWGATVLMATHNLGQACLAQRVVRMSDGQIVDDTPASVLHERGKSA
jgi:putative ABC transport system ATP-binding protein